MKQKTKNSYPKKVKYEVSKDEGYGVDGQEGDLYDVWLIIKDWNKGLLFHPSGVDVDGSKMCASISIGEADNRLGTRWVWLTAESAHVGFINLNKKQEKFFIKAFKIPKK